MMIKKHLKFLLFISLLTIGNASCSKSEQITNPGPDDSTTIVGRHGQLAVAGIQIVDKNGALFVPRGMSLFWSQWAPAYFNESTLKWLRDDWKCTIIRAPLAVEPDGYLKNPAAESKKIDTVIAACIKLGIYVIVDWHDHQAENHTQEAIAFFNAISAKYGKYPNLIYEIYNEPLNVSWKDVIKPYAQQIVNTIRANDPDNLIIVGTRNWSQEVDEVIGNRIDDPNVLYALHFYTGTHRQWLRDKTTKALAAGIPIFASEWGLSDATAGGEIDQVESLKWLNYLDANNLGSCNWSVNNKAETPSALLPTTTTLGDWKTNELSLSGQIVREYLRQRNSIYFK